MRALIAQAAAPTVNHWRFVQPAEALGLDYTLLPKDLGHTPAEHSRALAQFFAARGAEWDLLITNDHTPNGQVLIEHLKDQGTRIVVDVDDHVDGLAPGNVAIDFWHPDRSKWYHEIIEMADSVTVSTPWLKEQYGGTYCPNFIVPEDWQQPPRHKRDDSVLILCAAALGRIGDYNTIEKPLRAALALPNVKVMFVAYMPEWALAYPPGKVIHSRWWSRELFPQFLRWLAPDIVVSPLEHNDFNRAKSNIKWLESAMCGATFVGERWGELLRTVNEGETGVLAESEAEWTSSLIALCQDPTRRRVLAHNARHDVRDGWMWPAVSKLWQEGILDGKQCDVGRYNATNVVANSAAAG